MAYNIDFQLSLNAYTKGSSGIPDAPIDGEIYGRKDAQWVPVRNIDTYTKEEIDEKLEEKQDTLIAGDNVEIEGNTISANVPVKSVNNKIGEVVLDALDVSAVLQLTGDEMVAKLQSLPLTTIVQCKYPAGQFVHGYFYRVSGTSTNHRYVQQQVQAWHSDDRKQDRFQFSGVALANDDLSELLTAGDIVQCTSDFINPPYTNYIKGYFYIYGGGIGNFTQTDVQPTSGGAVDSVNGKTGDVVLDAIDVSAVPQVTGEFLYNGGSKIEDPKWQDKIVQCVEDFVLRDGRANYRAGYFYYIDSDGDLREQINTQPLQEVQYIQKSGHDLDDREDVVEGAIYQCVSDYETSHTNISNDTQFHKGYFYLFNGEQAQYNYTRIDTQPASSVSYSDLTNKPKINNVELTGNKSAKDLNLENINYYARFINYEINNNKATVTGLTASAPSKIIIPDTLEGYTVSSIANEAFSGLASLTSITIPDSVTSIGTNTFAYCTELTEVTIPDSVTSIGLNTFYGCTGLTEVTIPDSVTSINANAFADCTGLTDVYYYGTKTEWELINIGTDNDYLLGANIHYNQRTAKIADIIDIADDRTIYQKFIDKYNLTQRDWVDLQIIDPILKCYTSFDTAISDINNNDFSNAVASTEDAVCQIFIEDDIVVLRLLSNWTLKDKLIITSSVIIDFNGFTITLSSDNEYELVPQGESAPEFTAYTYYKNDGTNYYMIHDTQEPNDWETNYYTDYYIKTSPVGMIGDISNLQLIDGTIVFYGAKYGSLVTNDLTVSTPSTIESYSILANFKYVYFIGGVYEKNVVDINRQFMTVYDSDTVEMNSTVYYYNAYFNLMDEVNWPSISSATIYSSARYNSQIKFNIYNCKFYSKATYKTGCFNIQTVGKRYEAEYNSGYINAYNSKFTAYSNRGTQDSSTNAIATGYDTKLYNCEIVSIHAGLAVRGHVYAQNCKMTAPGHGGVYVESSATPTTNVARGYNGSSSATTMTKTYSFNSSSRPIILNPDTSGIQAYQGKYIRRIQLYCKGGGWLAIGTTTCKPWDGDTYDSSNFNNYMNFYMGSVGGYKNIYLPKPFYIPSDQYIFISHSPDIGGSPAIACGTPDIDNPNVVSFWEKNENDNGFTFVDDTIGINLIASKTGDVATFIAENCQFYQKQVDEIPMWNSSAAYCGYGSMSYFNNCSFEVDRLGEYRNVIEYDALKPWGTYDIYEKISDNNYSLLTEEPADWSNNYSNYYRLIPDVVTVKNGEGIYNTTASFSNCKFQYDNIRIDGNNTVYGGEGLSDRIKAVIQLDQGVSHLSEDRYDYFNYNDVPTQDYTTKQYVDDKTELLNNVDTTPTASSNNLITSGGVASALSDKQDVIDNNNKLSYTLLSDTPTIPTVDQTYDDTSANAQSGVAVASAISDKENTSNKVTSISAQSTDTQYPSAKCVYDIVGDIESLLNALR